MASSQALPLGDFGTVLEIRVDLLVGRDEARLGAAFDRHVAHGHAPFHRQRADRVAGIFERIAGAAGSADLADDGEDDVLGGDAGRQRAVDHGAHVLRFGLDQRLGRQHMLDLGSADAVGERAESAVRGGVAVAADERGARQREALLGPDDVDDALALVELVEIFDAEVLGVLGQIRRSAPRSPDPDWACCGRWSGRCDRPPAGSCRAHAPCAPTARSPRTPAGSSPRARDDGRCRSGRCRPAASSTRWSSQILS